MATGYVLAIDPGNVESAIVIVEKDSYRPLQFCKKDNEKVRRILRHEVNKKMDYESNGLSLEVAIEMIGHYGSGMPAGKTVFDTCVWIGRFIECCIRVGIEPTLIMRAEEKLTLCHSPKANDATIKQALIDRFAPGTSNYGKGTKKAPGFFYGFSADVWQAYAVAVTYIDKSKGN